MKYQNIYLALDAFRDAMQAKFELRDAKQGERSLVCPGNHILDVHPADLCRHFWKEINEWSEDWYNPEEGIDVANMAFLRWWLLEEAA